MSDTSPAASAKPPRSYSAGRPKVAPFARYEGTSAFRKDRRRAREYAKFKIAQRLAAKAPEISAH
jgi:hypothetical protein